MIPSLSEDRGLAMISDQDLKVYSVGISTGGVAEIRMARANPSRHIIATTIDPEGAKFAKERIQKEGFSEQIDVKIEDVQRALSYPDGSFDFIYARLVLHYLPKDRLMQALNELYRVLKTEGRIFVVVRSTDCLEAQHKDCSLDPDTGMTTYHSHGNTYSRYFHSRESIQGYLMASGFHIESVEAYQEYLCIDFQRTNLSKQPDALIEVRAYK